MAPIGLAEILLIVGIFAVANIVFAVVLLKMFARTTMAGLFAVLALIPVIGFLFRRPSAAPVEE